MQKRCLIQTTFVGYGDLLAHTPLIRFLQGIHEEVHVWTNNPDPFLYNPRVAMLLKPHGPTIPDASDFYYNNVFHVSGRARNLAHSHMDIVDFMTISGYGCQLRPQDKHLELFWPKRDEELVSRMLWQYRVEPGKFVVVAPTTSWRSRTLPFEFYDRLITELARRTKVVLVGKDVNPLHMSPHSTHLAATEMKGTYDGKRFLQKNVVNLMGQLTFSQLGYLYSQAFAAINTENGNMLASCTNDTCWNIYIPMVTPPEFRLPYRHGSQTFKTSVVEVADPYYPALDCNLGRESVPLTNAPTRLPTVEAVLEAYDAVA